MTPDQVLGVGVGILALTTVTVLTASWLVDRRNRRRLKKRGWRK